MKEIELTRGLFAIIDDEDFEEISKHQWFAVPAKTKKHRNGLDFYAAAKINSKSVRMHNFILKPSKGYEADHIDGNFLDNRRSNLREATRSQNCQNRKPRNDKVHSKYKGVDFHKGKYRARVTKNGKTKELGYFASEEEAARAYDQAASNLFGAFVRINSYVEK